MNQTGFSQPASPAEQRASDSRDEMSQLVGRYYTALKRFNASAQVQYNIHKQLHNLEYLVALTPGVDLAAGVSMQGEPQDRARQFLMANYQLFSFYRPKAHSVGLQQSVEDQAFRQQFDSQLFLKHSMTSIMGTHCIFGWRIAGFEAIDYSFVVHLDRQNHVVMVTSVYLAGDVPANCDLRPAYVARDQWLKQWKKVGEPVSEQVVVRRGATSYCCLQVKLTTEESDQVCLFCADGTMLAKYSVAFHAGPHRLGVTQIFKEFPAYDKDKPYPLAEALFAPAAGSVVLHGLKSNSDLQGRYVVVTDEIALDLFDTDAAQFLTDPDTTAPRSKFDRQMAYYHVDIIQRHFRHLGLDILDDYEHLNPIRVVLYPSDGRLRLNGPLYASNEQQIYITELTKGCTNAREARILYHEFVHAVTDALARLNRHEKVGPQEPRALQVWQAAAMDEGFADYFACSLAVRKQAPDAFFYAPPAIEDADDAEQAGAVPAGIAEDQPQQQLKWPAANIRKLGGRREDGDGYPALEYDLSCDSARQAIQDGSPIQVDEMIYQWAEQWGRYLWALRTKLGAEVADTLIAHSLFFMTRWSTFESGVLAIALADSLIFGGMKHDQILEDVQSACYWKFASEYQPPAQPADTRPAEETADMPRRRPRVNKSQPA